MDRYRIYYVSPLFSTGTPPYALSSGMEYVFANELPEWLARRPGTLITAIERMGAAV